jgi:hypothetical protein
MMETAGLDGPQAVRMAAAVSGGRGVDGSSAQSRAKMARPHTATAAAIRADAGEAATLANNLVAADAMSWHSVTEGIPDTRQVMEK